MHAGMHCAIGGMFAHPFEVPMNTNIKRTLAIVLAFAIGLLLSARVIAQDDSQIQRMEATIAQLQAELDLLKQQRVSPTETAWQPSLADPIISGAAPGQLIAPGYEAREEVLSAPLIQLPPETQQLPAATFSPSLIEQPLLDVPQLEIAPPLPSQFAPPTAIPPRVIQTPSQLSPASFEYCPLTGRAYSQRSAYYPYRVQYAPRQPSYREWDYWDEHRYGR